MTEPWHAIDPQHLGVFEELRPREPIFHTSDFGLTADERASAMAPDYWETGASGRRYSRAFILRHLADQPPADAAASGLALFGLRSPPPGPRYLAAHLHP